MAAEGQGKGAPWGNGAGLHPECGAGYVNLVCVCQNPQSHTQNKDVSFT